MSRIRGYDTSPERLVRTHLHRAGLRFRLNDRRLPGSPDLVLPKWNAVVFVHGCFWHRHLGCPKAYTPKSNASFWQAKFTANQVRDRQKTRELRQLGWRVFVVWECSLKSDRLNRLIKQIRRAT